MNRNILIAAASLSLLIAIAVGFLFFSNNPSPSSFSPAPQKASKVARSESSKPSTKPSTKSNWNSLTRDDLPVEQRLELARQLPTRLENEDVAALFTAMDHRPRPGAEESWYLVLNEIMEQMRRYGLGSEQYAARLGAMISDPARPEVVRDYAIQHLALWIAPGNPEQVPHEQNPEMIAQSLAHISQAIQEPSISQSSIPGTALLTLADISPNLPAEQRAATWHALQPYLEGVISGEKSAHLSTQVSALQAVARTKQAQFLPTIRAIAANESSEPSLRLSSIASLGSYADPADQALLEALASGTTRYQYAAQSALQRLTPQP